MVTKRYSELSISLLANLHYQMTKNKKENNIKKIKIKIKNSMQHEKWKEF